MSQFLAWLQAMPRKRVELEELKAQYFSLYPEVQNSPERAARLLAELQALTAAGHIALPSAASWERAGRPALPNFITVVKAAQSVPREDFTQVAWVPELGFWHLLTPSQLGSAKRINDFLLRRRGSLRLVPLKERSLEIFGDEKRLENMRSGMTLFSGRLHISVLGAFAAPAPLPYRLADAPGCPVLILENRDSFWSFGEWNQTAKRYAGVVYGGGDGFLSTGTALAHVLHEVQGAGALYLGDLDVKGVRIPLEFNAARTGDEPGVLPDVALYEWLLENGTKRAKPECRDGALTDAQAWLGSLMGDRLHAMWQEGMWIPQESLGYEQLAGWGLANAEPASNETPENNGTWSTR